MALLEQKDQEYLREAFGEIVRPVKLVMFTQARECQYCRETREIVEEVVGLSPLLRAQVLDFEQDAEEAKRLGIEQIPAIAVLSEDDAERDYGIRFYGIPSGYEFSAFVEAIIMVGRNDSGLAEETRKALAGLTSPVHLQVFVTPTCPYCPRAVHLAHQMAFESERVRADSVEAIEFPHLANRFSVRGVPKTVINEIGHVEGAIPERNLLQQVLEVAGQAA